MTGVAPVVVVLGMHRGGTSAVAGALAALGLSPGAGSRLLPPTTDNPRGYFERRDVVDTNEALLVALVRERLGADAGEDLFEEPLTMDGLGWLFGAWLAPEALQRPPAASLAARLERCLASLREEAGDAPALLLKDPRLCLTLPAWRDRGQRWLAVVALRSPAAVLASLQRRDGMSLRTACELWSSNLRSALAVSAGLPRITLDYDALLAEPEVTLRQAVAFLRDNGIALATRDLAAAVNSVDPRLSHGEATPDEDPEARTLLAAATAVHHRLLESGADAAGLESLWPAPDEAGLQRGLRLPLRYRLQRCEQHIVQLGEHIERLDRSRAALARVEAHPLAGGVLRLLRRLKRDPSFGRP